jgi:uncharacterized protein YdhG (YjbR/CyaY superfamily)
VADKFANVDDYIGSFPEDVQVILEEVRRRIRNVAPSADELITYEIPALAIDGRSLVHFAAWKHHISLYPVPAADGAFGRELERYRAGKGTLSFPLQEPIPYDLIERVVALLLTQRTGTQG